MPYKVSVIIPIYNVEPYLPACLDSVAAQTLESLEIILVDDGSTDGSSRIAKEFADTHENAFYYAKENGGLGQARNFGMQYVHGEYVVFLDSDDVVPPAAYETMLKKAEETGVDMVTGAVIRMDGTREFVSHIHKKAFCKSYDRTGILEAPQLVYDTTSWNKLIRMDFWRKYDFRFPEHILYEDLPVTMPLHFLADGVSVIPEIVYKWRVRGGANPSITQNRTDPANFRDRVTVMKMVDDFYRENVTDERALFYKDYKWMETDLHLYIRQLPGADAAFVKECMTTTADYVASMRRDSFDALPKILRMQYAAVMDGDEKRLKRLLVLEKIRNGVAKIRRGVAKIRHI